MMPRHERSAPTSSGNTAQLLNVDSDNEEEDKDEENDDDENEGGDSNESGPGEDDE